MLLGNFKAIQFDLLKTQSTVPRGAQYQFPGDYEAEHCISRLFLQQRPDHSQVKHGPDRDCRAQDRQASALGGTLVQTEHTLFSTRKQQGMFIARSPSGPSQPVSTSKAARTWKSQRRHGPPAQLLVYESYKATD
ncbi:hypothetical protein PENANT_c019G07666 [Penicillium antarcticum]|uniref:Uncharacterized protein n=1 Tax=Penicillium antarcticum TaxID=416450 RepID=A0A1V6Q0T5_9EURO|nr:hypothetical protein PENANT_c019G07666 [Penicillium antarcticum]